MRYVIAEEGAVVELGRQGENEVVTVQFDVSGWRDEYGDGTFTLVHQRCMDGDGFEREITLDDEIISWVITNVDVAYAGKGVLQLTYTVGEAVAKSAFYYTKVKPSLNASENVPNPWKPWMEKVEKFAEDAEAWAVGTRHGVVVPSTDDTYHNNSKYYSEYLKNVLFDQLIPILRAAEYTSDQTEAINALADALSTGTIRASYANGTLTLSGFTSAPSWSVYESGDIHPIYNDGVLTLSGFTSTPAWSNT